MKSERQGAQAGNQAAHRDIGKIKIKGSSFSMPPHLASQNARSKEVKRRTQGTSSEYKNGYSKSYDKVWEEFDEKSIKNKKQQINNRNRLRANKEQGANTGHQAAYRDIGKIEIKGSSFIIPPHLLNKDLRVASLLENSGTAHSKAHKEAYLNAYRATWGKWYALNLQDKKEKIYEYNLKYNQKEINLSQDAEQNIEQDREQAKENINENSGDDEHSVEINESDSENDYEDNNIQNDAQNNIESKINPKDMENTIRENIQEKIEDTINPEDVKNTIVKNIQEKTEEDINESIDYRIQSSIDKSLLKKMQKSIEEGPMPQKIEKNMQEHQQKYLKKMTRKAFPAIIKKHLEDLTQALKKEHLKELNELKNIKKEYLKEVEELKELKKEAKKTLDSTTGMKRKNDEMNVFEIESGEPMPKKVHRDEGGKWDQSDESIIETWPDTEDMSRPLLFSYDSLPKSNQVDLPDELNVSQYLIQHSNGKIL